MTFSSIMFLTKMYSTYRKINYFNSLINISSNEKYTYGDRPSLLIMFFLYDSNLTHKLQLQ